MPNEDSAVSKIKPDPPEVSYDSNNWHGGYEQDEVDDDECQHCRGDGRDPCNDYLLPCPVCQGSQQP